MPIAYISKTTKLGNDVPFDHITTAATDGLIIVCSNRLVNVDSTAKFNDVALTVAQNGWGAGGYWRTSIHYMQNPPIGTYHIDTINGDVAGVTTAINVSGLLKTGNPVRFSDYSGGSCDPMVAHFTSLVGDGVFDVIVVAESSWHPNSGQTLIDSNWFGGNALHGCSFLIGALTDPSWHRGAADDGSYTAVDFIPAPVFGSSPMWWF